MSPNEVPRKNILERALSVVTIVEPGEGVTALLMSVNIFMLLAAYYVIKPVREAFVTVDWANTGTAIMALLLIPTVRAYGVISQKFSRKKLISYVTAFFISNLVIFYLLAEIHFRYMGIFFFVWVGIFNNLVIAQFWAYGNDIYRPDQGKRLFPLIMLGSSVGAILGPLITGVLGKVCGTNPLLLLAGFMLAGCIAMTIWIDNREKQKPLKAVQRRVAEKALGPEGGFSLVWKHRYLLFIALLIVVLNVVNTTGEQLRRKTFNESARVSAMENNPGLSQEELEDKIQSIKLQLNSDFFFWVNLLSVLIQALLVSRILKLIGVRGALLLVPIVVFLGYGMMALLPTLWVVSTVKVVENSQDYSLMNTLRAALYLPTTREMKYKAKQVIDTFFVRLGDLISAGIWFIGAHYLALTVQGFAESLLVLVGFWMVLAILIRREHKKMMPDEESPPEIAGAEASA